MFEHNFNVTPGCWNWNKRLTSAGYGKFGNTSAHRVSYALYVGQIPDGMCVLHRCDNKKCVNPDHLFIGTQQDNVKDMNLKGRGGRTKLSTDEVKKIRQAALEGETQGRIAIKFQVHRVTVNNILAGRKWGWVK